MQSRITEAIVNILLGVVVVWIAATRESANYAVFFYLMAVMFFLAIFRPRKFP